MRKKREADIQALLEQLDSGVVHLDGSGTITFINRKAEEILRVDRTDVLGRRLDMLPLRTPIYRVLSEDSHDEPLEISVDGGLIQVRTTRLPGVEGCAEMYQFRDISVEKREKRQREEFVAMMTHDLKSPLTVIMGYIQALMGEMPQKIDPSLHLFVREIDRSSGKMLGMIDDVLDAYRLEVGLLQIDRQPCNVRALLEGCCRDGAREAAVHGSFFQSDLAPEALVMDLDSKQIGRVFANLIGNAVKFTPRRGSIEVKSALQNGCFSVEVRDTGIGIPEEEVPRIFNKYFRSRAARGFKGTGLGLTISKAIVEAHGGRISVESQAGEGSLFCVSLPVGAAPES